MPYCDAGPPPYQMTVNIGVLRNNDWRVPSLIGVTGVPLPQPRPVHPVATLTSDERAGVSAELRKLFLDFQTPPVQIFDADLDGDGTAERLILAEQLTDPRALRAEPGEYSVLFLHVGDETQYVLSIYGANEDGTSFNGALRISAIADLNGDGRMEVAVETTHPYGRGTALWEFVGGELVHVAGTGCREAT